MAGDIFFTNSRVWLTSSAYFEDLMARAIGKCTADEAAQIEIFSEAQPIRRLGLNLLDDRKLQAALTRRVLEAASEDLQELRADPKTDPRTLGKVEELIAM